MNVDNPPCLKVSDPGLRQVASVCTLRCHDESFQCPAREQSPRPRCQSSFFLSFVLGAVECLCGRRRNHPVEKIIIAETKYQASLNHHQLGRRPSIVFDFL